MIDILFSNHRVDGSSDRPGPHNHLTDSMLYWGDRGGFSPQKRWDFPANGPHAMNLRDVGNTYDRGLWEDYVSSPFQLPGNAQPRTLRWTAQTPHRTKVALQLRRADSQDALGNASWEGPAGADSWYETSGASVKPSPARWVQYRARLHTPNGGPTPYLTSVTVDYD
jgi:hypothetical protein